MSEWQPIETAPKDGTVVILHGWYDYQCREPMAAGAGLYRDAYWWRDNNGYGFVVTCTPTHWMPLPEPPK